MGTNTNITRDIRISQISQLGPHSVLRGSWHLRHARIENAKSFCSKTMGICFLFLMSSMRDSDIRFSRFQITKGSEYRSLSGVKARRVQRRMDRIGDIKETRGRTLRIKEHQDGEIDCVF